MTKYDIFKLTNDNSKDVIQTVNADKIIATPAGFALCSIAGDIIYVPPLKCGIDICDHPWHEAN